MENKSKKSEMKKNTEKRIVVLYSALAPYFVESINYLVENYSVEILLFSYPQNALAPFKFDLDNRIKYIQNEKITKNEIFHTVSNFKPDLIYVTGWNDNKYRFVAEKYVKSVPVVMGLDGFFQYKIKQILFLSISQFFLKRYFNIIWACGSRQFHYARLLGYKDDEIILGLYSSGLQEFVEHMEKVSITKEIVFAGRLVSYKYFKQFYRAFMEINETLTDKWILKVTGRGPDSKVIKENEHVIFEDFMQPQELSAFVKNSAVFCLPSISENWGVTVHDFALLGKTLFVSSEVAAGDEFVIHKYNGYVFKSNDFSSLKFWLEKLLTEDLDKHEIMGKRSKSLASRNNFDLWSARLMSKIT